MVVLNSDDKIPFRSIDDNLFDFTFDDEIDDQLSSIFNGIPTFSSSSSLLPIQSSELSHGGQGGSFPELGDELEWMFNKDTFPELLPSHHSSMSMLDNINCDDNGNTSDSSFNIFKNIPVRARSKRPRTKRSTGFIRFSLKQHWLPKKRKTNKRAMMPNNVKRCTHCQADSTPQWRTGPMGSMTLCNACGLRYMSGRLLPEYRPVGSPTFSSTMHSNSHKKVIEIRMKKGFTRGNQN